MKIKTITLTPELATRLLNKNPMNRRISERVVADYARDIIDGHWQLNGDAIRVNAENLLIDGQHRCAAVVAANRSIETILITDIEPDAYKTIDSGRKRTNSDRLEIEGITNSRGVAAILRTIAIYAKQGMNFRGSITPSEQSAALARHPEVEIFCSQGAKAYPGMNTIVPALSYIGYYLGHEERSNAWEAMWRSGVPDYDGDPAHLFRERYSRLRGTPNAIKTDALHNLACTAFSSFLVKRPVRKLKMANVIRVPGWDIQAMWGKK